MPENRSRKPPPRRITSERERASTGTSRRRRRWAHRAVSLEARIPTVTEPKGPTADQLRHDIYRGRTGDKLSRPDPAQVPLATGEQAPGTRRAPRHVAARRQAHRL